MEATEGQTRIFKRQQRGRRQKKRKGRLIKRSYQSGVQTETGITSRFCQSQRWTLGQSLTRFSFEHLPNNHKQKQSNSDDNIIYLIYGYLMLFGQFANEEAFFFFFLAFFRFCKQKCDVNAFLYQTYLLLEGELYRFSTGSW